MWKRVRLSSSRMRVSVNVVGSHSSQRAWWSWSSSAWFSVERTVKGCLQAFRDDTALPLGVLGPPRAPFLRDASMRFWDDINEKPPLIRVALTLCGKAGILLQGLEIEVAGSVTGMFSSATLPAGTVMRD